MSGLTDQQKQTVLDLIRAGRDRQQAAQAIGLTGTQLKRVCSPASSHYDADFHNAYNQAVTERDSDYYLKERPRDNVGEPTRTTPRGHLRWQHLTDDQLEEFLEMISIGTPNSLAASEIGTSLRQIDLLSRRNHDFHDAYMQALSDGQPMFHEMLRAEYVRQAIKEGNLQALRDLAIVHLPEFDKLRTSKHEHTGPGGQPIQVLQAVIKDLPPEIVDQLIAHEQKKLDAGKQALPPVVDADEAA